MARLLEQPLHTRARATADRFGGGLPPDRRCSAPIVVEPRGECGLQRDGALLEATRSTGCTLGCWDEKQVWSRVVYGCRLVGVVHDGQGGEEYRRGVPAAAALVGWCCVLCDAH